MTPAMVVPTMLRSTSQFESCIFCQYRQLFRLLRQQPRIQSDHLRLPRRSQSTKSVSRKHANGTVDKPAVAPGSSALTSPVVPANGQSSKPPNKDTTKSPSARPRPHVRARDGELVPKPLSRPLGLPHPPEPGQNTGIDNRSWTQRREDFASYDKHLERREGLIRDLYEKNYFRDLGNVGKIHKGKSMLAPATPFRKDLAHWFPNLRGLTLRTDVGDVDTTGILKGKVSVVKFLSTDWADRQCETFVGKTANADLWEAMEREKETLQLVEINVETNWLKWALVRMFMGRLRKMREQSQWDKYFLVRRGLDDNIKEAMGIWNSMIGYVYLLDPQCKIRWAGNGDANDDEKKSLVACVRRLVDEAKGVQRPRAVRQEQHLKVDNPGFSSSSIGSSNSNISVAAP